jgi:hypothetical protein
MSINQAAIHFNLPYSSLYGRFKRGKYGDPPNGSANNDSSHNTTEHSPDNSMSYGHHTLITDSNATTQLQENIIYQQHYSPSPQSTNNHRNRSIIISRSSIKIIHSRRRFCKFIR